ncbi:uncharacterized protein F5Z01DRAFT_676490 [Emericellopsis atlantica]|uniref:Uncharacterized protein n=1 Tax=Emericellopsis atlantica TaxID=2614577 RepID=A0A9P7ZGV9_9HYPO|nr:uncharacterized protein F5Z01DRAFT_676490 [Emericellopsis atlantica]KAG9251918.1 hypothetical protein F5Z01DRAFT_676490 [Emericellopsis atlantica]
MTRPIILHPATPAELVTLILHHYWHPTTVIVGSPKQPFMEAFIYEVNALPEETLPQIRRKTLLQTSVSRHIRVAFAPTVTHLRGFLSVFTQSDSRVSPPPHQSQQQQKRNSQQPLLIAYGFLEVHRMTTEWSAQGLGTSAGSLVEAAMRNGFRAAIVEPRGGGDGFESWSSFAEEKAPVLNGTVMRESGAWAGRMIEVGRILGRWFEIERLPDEEVIT